MIRILSHSHLVGSVRLLVAASALLARPGLAQRIERRWDPAPLRVQFQAQERSTATAYNAAPALADSNAIPRTHWLEGGAIVGGLAGVAGGILAVGLCGYDSPCLHPALAAVTGAVLMGLVGFGLGALIGGQFPKH
jgi:hypothetical protein